MKIFTYVILLIFPLFAYGNISKDNDVVKPSWKISEASKIKNDFAAALILTPDKDWKEKWDTPQEVAPSFTEANTVKIGDELMMLIFFSNPKPDKENNINIVCDIKIIRPDKSTSINQKGIPCFGGQLQGPANNIRLSNALAKFTAEETDPLGTWVVEIGIEDVNRKTKLILKTQYEFIGAGKNTSLNNGLLIDKKDASHIIQLAIDAPDIQDYFHAEQLADRKPLYIKLPSELNGLDINEVKKFKQPVIFVTENIKNPIFEILDWKESENDILFNASYNVEGLYVSYQFHKSKETWLLSAIKVVER